MINYPGITSTALRSCFLSKSQLCKYKMSGWTTLKEDGTDGVAALAKAKSIKEVLFKLKLLGGFLMGTRTQCTKGD